MGQRYIFDMMPLLEDSCTHTYIIIPVVANSSKSLAMDLEMRIACLKF